MMHSVPVLPRTMAKQGVIVQKADTHDAKQERNDAKSACVGVPT